MEAHHFIDAPVPPHHIRYNLVLSENSWDIILLPAVTLFYSHTRNGYTGMPLDITVYWNALAAVEDEA